MLLTLKILEYEVRIRFSVEKRAIFIASLLTDMAF